MWISHRNKFIVLIILSAISLLLQFFYKPDEAPPVTPPHAVMERGDNHDSRDSQETEQYKNVSFTVTPKRRIHILYGDATGGGHKFGAGKKGKTEFPESWDEEKIINTVTRIANDNTLPMRPSGPRYWLRLGEDEGLKIRVVLNPEKGEIVTGYPINRPRNE